MPAYEYAYIMNAMEQSGTSSSKLLHASGGCASAGNTTTSTAVPTSAPSDEARYSMDTESVVKGTKVDNLYETLCAPGRSKLLYFLTLFSMHIELPRKSEPARWSMLSKWRTHKK